VINFTHRLEAGGALDQPAVVLRGVGFHYPNGEDLFTGVDLSVRSADRIALLGENGAGKTTLVKVMTTFSDPARPNQTHALRFL